MRDMSYEIGVTQYNMCTCLRVSVCTPYLALNSSSRSGIVNRLIVV